MSKIELDWDTEEQPLAMFIDALKRESVDVRKLKLAERCGGSILEYMKVIQVAKEHYNPPYDKKEAYDWIIECCNDQISKLKGNIALKKREEVPNSTGDLRENKLKYVNEMLHTVSSWRMYDGSVVANFIDEAQYKIQKIDGPQSIYAKEIDIFSSAKNAHVGVVADWQEQLITVLKKLKFKIETEGIIMKEPNKTYQIHCNKCNLVTNHIVLAENVENVDIEEPYGYETLKFWQKNYAQIIKCGSCNEVGLRKFDIWSEDVPDFPENNITLFPKRGKSLIKAADTFHSVPSHISDLYREVIDAFINEINLLCAGGIRATLEAICKDKGIKGGNVGEKYTESLKGRIYGLAEKKFITPKHAEILVDHQYLGDKALHELEKPSSEELEIAIQIIALTLSSIYDLESQGRELKDKKERRTKS